MISLRQKLFRAPFSQRLFCSTAGLQDITSSIPFIFNPTINIVDRVDVKFQTGKSFSNEIVEDKDQTNKVKNIYYQLFRTLSGNSTLEQLKSHLEPRLIQELEEGLAYLKENDLKIGILGSSLLGKGEADIFKRIDVAQLGYLKVFNAEIERNKNLFIHEYEIVRTDDRLIYTPKQTPEMKSLPTSRKEKNQKEMIEALKEKKEDKPVQDAVMWTAKKLGFMTPEELQQPPKFLMNMFNLKNRLYGTVESEDHILVEDYEILSPFGLYVQNKKTNEIIKSEGKDGESFRHFLRIERIVEAKDAPSVKKAKPILLVDFDFSLRGNPHTPVKNFAGL